MRWLARLMTIILSSIHNNPISHNVINNILNEVASQNNDPGMHYSYVAGCASFNTDDTDASSSLSFLNESQLLPPSNDDDSLLETSQNINYSPLDSSSTISSKLNIASPIIDCHKTLSNSDSDYLNVTNKIKKE